jgi:pimeloyl-ACP methyl ester carboxylesterase
MQVVCMEFSGHGRSSHRSLDAEYGFISRMFEVLDVVDALHWERFTIMGHSMGAGIASYLGAVLKDRIEKLILIDGIGLYGSSSDPVRFLARQIANRQRGFTRQRRIYSNYDSLVQKYLQRNQALLESSARILLQRNTEEVLLPDDSHNDSQQTGSEVNKNLNLKSNQIK